MVPRSGQQVSNLDSKRKLSDMSEASDNRLQAQNHRPIAPAPNSILNDLSDSEFDPNLDASRPRRLEARSILKISEARKRDSGWSDGGKRLGSPFGLFPTALPQPTCIGNSALECAAAEKPPLVAQEKTKTGIWDRHLLQTPLVDETLTARADIAIMLLNCDKTESLRNNINTRFGRPELPLPFKNMDQLPILTSEVKSFDGSSLKAENQATKPEDRQANPPATTDAEMTSGNATGSTLHATEETEEVGVNHVFGMHVDT
ncbi:hypothetical protein TWF788_008279 [Orbilia oligospora]|uniref:Uncharacterized protein n=1 Tax=Orbilia oligospora TaxID=2813651 RepID=A0A7C8U1C8_ORBOL|nr:hypothetical protein TWF788_008279 [Orbilia oligospora]